MRWTLHTSDCLEKLREMESGSFDALLSDPPYGLSFMGKAWDHGVPSVEVWQEALRVLKPGAFLLAFGGTRTYHRLACAIEDAGFEVRDCLMWLYGSGFPKSYNISKSFDRASGDLQPENKGFTVAGYSHNKKLLTTAPSKGYLPPQPITESARTWSGYGTALKPAWEPCLVAMKPLDGTFAQNALKHGVAGINVEAGRIETSDRYTENRVTQGINTAQTSYDPRRERRTFEPGSGRWPANLILDAEAGAMLDGQTGELHDRGNYKPGEWKTQGEWQGPSDPVPDGRSRGGSGGASRFFYCPKASRRERDAGLDGFEVKTCDDWQQAMDPGAPRGVMPRANNHPCLKPLDLNRYLASLILPPKRDTPRRILVPFSGSGSEMIGALLAGWDEVVGIEKEQEYCDIANARLNHWCKHEQSLFD